MAQHRALTISDVQQLLRDSPVQTRIATAAQFARSFRGDLTGDERALAHDVFRLMVRDAETKVRKALAENLKDNPDIPHDVARALAEDVETVAAPLLEYSTVLTDADLDAIVRSGAISKQVAVASRHDLSETVSRTIAVSAGPLAVEALLTNHSAAIPDDAFNTALDRFGDHESIQLAMVDRSRLPVTVAERLVEMVSASLRERLLSEHELSPDMAADLLLQARERATVELALSADRMEVSTLVKRLHARGRLTQTLILRAVCAGDFDFFESALAELAGIPVNNAFRLIHDRGGQGLVGLVGHCGLSDDFLEVSRVALAVVGELQIDGLPGDRDRFAERMIERVLTYFEDRFDTGNLDYLIGRLGRHASAAAQASSAVA